ncbi:zonular occludens toxin [Lysobacter sp. HDW10]|uniref:zonular occludens toxin domain-containing protein n=1 Tax=Lysobacter sp. HDW10 TaxID=2714936 RepID=UPI00140A1188|nr:zonular occludens toxin domain-containing protein [Lysobacter sp. HDW10]QIK81671.1 zonular occludens toxin [Lysobacter sp. HDW10]
MIYFYTGKPGAGKTALALTKARELLKEGREIYAWGVKDLDYDRIGFKALPDPKEWESYPDGSVFFLDEAYGIFPSAAPGSKVPPHIEALARHRHRGFDFILICQQPLQLHWFLRGLVEDHYHVEKIWKSRKTDVKHWTEYQGNTKASSNDKTTWVRDKEIFDFYTSTTLDTTGGIQIPRWVKLVALMAALVSAGVWFAKHRAETKIAEIKAERAATVASVAGQAGAASSLITKETTPEEYAKLGIPRLAAAPWSAPIYDARAVVSKPEIYCMSSGPGLDGVGKYRDASCTCLTEQGTRYEIGFDVCSVMAKNGSVYNPFKEPKVNTPQVSEMNRVSGSNSQALGSAAAAIPVTSASTVNAPAGDPPGQVVGSSLGPMR